MLAPGTAAHKSIGTPALPQTPQALLVESNRLTRDDHLLCLERLGILWGDRASRLRTGALHSCAAPLGRPGQPARRGPRTRAAGRAGRCLGGGAAAAAAWLFDFPVAEAGRPGGGCSCLHVDQLLEGSVQL